MVIQTNIENMIPNHEEFGRYFHELFKQPSEDQRKRNEWKKLKRHRKYSKGTNRRRNKLELLNGVVLDGGSISPPEIELPGNASSFAVFASVRLAVIERWMRQAAQEYLQSSCSSVLQNQHDLSEIDSDTEENSQSTTYLPMRVSKIVGLGLRSVFELIRESRSSHPILCTKALRALLDVLQGQSPEGLKSEPSEIIDPLFDLLLDLATSHGPESSVPNDGSHLTAVACACLLCLVVVRGDTGKYLSAIGALLMCPRALAIQNIQMPAVLTSLQRSVHGVLLGKLIRPEWMTHGISHSSEIDTYRIRLPSSFCGSILPKSMASDGQFLYLFCNRGLMKIGTGYGGTLKGHVYIWNSEFHPNDKGWIGFCNKHLYLKLNSRRNTELLKIDRDSLHTVGVATLDPKDFNACVIFSDGDNLGTIAPAKDDGFIVRTLNVCTNPVSLVSELPLKLARKCVDVLGVATYEEEGLPNPMSTGTDDEIATICAGKEFGLVRTTTGKVLYSGKPSSLGIKQAGVRTSKWSELAVTKSPKVTHVAIGHDGLHAVLLTEDGSVFFTGTARRGEDGDQNKARRQPKPVKPKKMIKVDGRHIVHAACNNGSTALVTRDGELLMFGKDTAHADHLTGQVCGLRGEFVTQVALGKAHAVALTSKGQVYTFGINNKYQCGRDFAPQMVRDGSVMPVAIAMDTCVAGEDVDLYDIPSTTNEDVETQQQVQQQTSALDLLRDPFGDQLCPSGKHVWKHELCMVCTICRECTGYSISCLSSMRPDRNPGQECGCGEGDSGCAICGCCRICARESVDNSELALLGQPSGPSDPASAIIRISSMNRVKEIDQNSSAGRHGKLQEHLQRRLDERKMHRQRKSATSSSGKQHGMLKYNKQSTNSPRVAIQSASAIATANKIANGIVPVSNTQPISNRQIGSSAIISSNIPIVKEQAGSDVERDPSRVVCFPPARLTLPSESPVVEIACGLHHTVLLLQNGQVYTFGSNQYGQLGCGDILAQAGIIHVKLSVTALHIAAGSNHTVILTTKGEVYTFGNNQKGQLGRDAPNVANGHDSQPGQSGSSRYNPRNPWYSIPGQIPNIGPKHGRRATWVGASADQTFLKIDESLINSISLAKSTVIANKSSIILVPNQPDYINNFKCLVINKHDGSCNSFSGVEQVNFCNLTTCMDSTYNVLWAYNNSNHEISCYNVIAADILQNTTNKVFVNDKKVLTNIKSAQNDTLNSRLVDGFDLLSILSPELALPTSSNCYVTRLQAAVHLLGCLDTLTAAHDLKMTSIREEIDDGQLLSGKTYSRDDFQTVNRFESHGGGWGYSGHSIEAIRFMADTDLLLGGFGLFGGRGEYNGKIKLLDIGADGGEQEGDGDVLAETEEIPYECGPRQKYPMIFDEPVPLQAHRWYVAWCRISGPSSDCGSSGQSMVTTEDQVTFYFKSSKKSNNGTDVNAGQIPQLLYRVVTPENQSTSRPIDIVEPVYILNKDFSRTVTKECFQSLISLLQWSWNTFKLGVIDNNSSQQITSILELERLVFISRSTLRLIKTYTNEIYPNQVSRKIQLESVHLAESIGDVRALLKQILSDNLPLAILARKSSGKMKQLPKTNNQHIRMMNGILDECHNTFVACFHAFYPTAYLKWNCLCDLLSEINKESEINGISGERLLSAVLCALCGPSVRLRSTFPLLSGSPNFIENSLNRKLSPSDNTGLPMMPGSDVHHYPVLVEQMSYKSQVEGSGSGLSWSWREVLEKLLNLVTEPVKQQLLGHRSTTLSSLTRNSCHLLARVVAELVQQCSSSEDELQGVCGRVLHTTPSRFTRTNQSRTWNTGNGSPDAICFQVDRSGVSIAGVVIYGGLGHYEYELEILEDQSSASAGQLESHAHTQRWNNLETVRGSFGPEDYNPDIIEIKFDRPVSIKENIKYAFRLRNHGGRTSNGDGGLNTVKGPDGTTFTFSTCSLSFNGTTQTRGQIPHVLYYSSPLDSDARGHASRAMAELQARRCALSMTTTLVQGCTNLLVLARERAEDVPAPEILSDSCIVTTLVPLVLCHVSPLVTNDSRSAVQVLSLIQEMLPHVAALNLMSGQDSTLNTYVVNQADSFEDRMNCTTTSQHYTWVQSDHPYKAAGVYNYRVAFPETVKWLSIEFDPSCGTAQPEDCLQLYVPGNGMNEKYGNSSVRSEMDDTTSSLPYWSVLHKFSSCGSQWPQSSVILPGSEVIFSLETASDYLKDDKANTFGFRCLVVGYEWPIYQPNTPSSGLKHLETELSFLGGMCAASLMKKDLQLYNLTGDESEGDVEIAEIVAQQTLAAHGSLISKGLALSCPPTVSQALDGILPFSVQCNERLFLRDFVNCVAGTSGGRLAQWLQPASRVDPSKCQVLYNREELRCGWPAIVTILTRDQYGDLVHVNNMKVEVKAVPIDKKELGDCDQGRKIRRLSQPDPLTFGGQTVPPLQVQYEPTVRDKMCFHSITIMKAYQNYSFEELRYASPPVKRSSENMLVRPNGDGTYSATWTPASIGCYSVLVNIDGYDMEDAYKVEVREPPQGMTPPSQNLVKKPTHQPSRLRKFVAKNSAGLRIRTHPSLQSEQIGIVHVNGTIAFIDEIHNDDGVWLRLSADTIKQYCSIPTIEAWCLQYNQHLGKTLLLPVEEPKSILDQVITETILRKLPELHDRRKTSIGQSEVLYQVIKCGASGHNVRSRPSLKAPPVGMLVLGNQIGVSEYIVNSDGCWVLLDQDTREKYCFNHEGEAWSLAMSHNNVLYLGSVGEETDYSVELQPQIPESFSGKRGFDFSSTSVPKEDSSGPFAFGSCAGTSSSHFAENPSTNPFIFGDSERTEGSPKMLKREKYKESKLQPIPKWLKTESEIKRDKDEPRTSYARDIPVELSGVSVKELVKAIGESRANGNGVTPPDTPRRSISPRSAPSPKVLTRSSSPIAIPAALSRVSQPSASANNPVATAKDIQGVRAGSYILESPNSSPVPYGSSRSIAVSPLVSCGANAETSHRRGSTQSDTSALVSSLTRDLSQSPSQATQPRDLTLSPSGSSIHTRSEDCASPPQSPKKENQITQTQTQNQPQNQTYASLENEQENSQNSPRKLTQTGTQTSPENSASTSIRSHFSIGTSGKEERVSPKLSRKDRSLSGGKSRQSKRAISPANLHIPSSSKVTIPQNEPVKQAISPSVAESLRAVFAAFLWHEGIVHDAMACASFLKFHPTLPKKGALVVTRQGQEPVNKRKSELTKEEKARQRHSVEVTGNYLHIQPSTLETLTRSAANANAVRRKKVNHAEGIIKEDMSYHTVTVLPPALKSLVYLWDELTSNCLQAIMQQMVISSPSKSKKMEKVLKIDKETRDKNSALEKEIKKTSRKKKEWKPVSREDLILGTGFFSQGEKPEEAPCELCGEIFPHPVTYHMRSAHPGCGSHAGGKGYNSSGNYCVGWAGNCGEGGVSGSSWYLVCDTCRDKYISSKGKTKTKSRKKAITQPIKLSPASGIGIDAHLIMKNNAMFLLDLASSANISHRRPSSLSMPSVSENQSPPECLGPFGPFPPFQCLRALGATAPNEDCFFDEDFKRGNQFNQRPLSEVSISDNEVDIRGTRFHRSISMGTNGLPFARTGLDGRVIMMRKRNNSSSESTESGSSLLCNPSATLQKLIPNLDTSAIVSNPIEANTVELGLLQRPVMMFVLQHHDLEALQLAMKQALRKATCRVYAMQALNWLLRSVTQPICLHDLLWWFVASLTPTEFETETEDDNKMHRRIEDQEFNVCEHPLSDIVIAGDAVHPLPSTFHALLQTIADLMLLLPMGSPLQQMAVRCWGLRFTQADHTFLHRSQVFSNISKILSRSEELEDCSISMHESINTQNPALVECLKDLTSTIEIKSSSRQAMIGSLVDGSTETFWESGDEDRNKTKTLTLACSPHSFPRMVCLHIDNCRDLANKVSSLTFFSGPNSDELIKICTFEVESRVLGGWINCPIQEKNHSVIRVELKGPDNSLRVRQLRVLGEVPNETLRVGKQYSAMTIQQRNCEAETLRVFRLITSQVFGKLIQSEESCIETVLDDGATLEESNDLREHMVGILFSRSKLTHLQKQVIVHIVQAIRKEASRVREEWESILCSAIIGSSSSGQSLDLIKTTDTYCFEMLSMVLALSGSSVGRTYLSHQHLLLIDILSLLHTGSARVQRQVTSLLRRMLPEISAETLAKVLGVDHLPPVDFSIVSVVNRDSATELFDIHRMGILDVFLSIIAKSLTVQVKMKSKEGANGSGGVKGISTVTLATSIHPRDYIGNRWWLRGTVNRKLADVIIQLLKDMAAGKLSEPWANVTKAAVAENILNLTRLSEDQRNPTVCLHTPTLWLALASLCVLDKDHVEQLSSGQWSNAMEGQSATPRPTCTNHDDGETSAIIQCNVCGNLCADCDRFLHLHRKTRMHQRQVCKEEEEAIKVELHEGCGRTKLFWLLALADARTLKALVEFREGGTRTRIAGASGVCRFCGATGNSGLLAIGNVCADHECQEYARSTCNKIHSCGHLCGGVQNEASCLPCLHGCSAASAPSLRQDADDMCMICFTEALSCAPAIQLKCGHVFHLHCCRAVLMKRWAGPRITFSFSLCPICKANMDHPILTDLLIPITELYNDVKRKALMRLEYEGLHTTEAITLTGSRFYNDPTGYAMDRYAYYVCYKCNKAYYGGEARCDAEVGENYDPTELVCGACSDVARAQMCPKHGTDFLEYKCRYCCSVAVFFCFGTTHFCNPCHDDFQRVTNLPKNELPSCPAGPKAKQLEGDECPLHVKHPPTGEEFALGCGVCRNAHTF